MLVKVLILLGATLLLIANQSLYSTNAQPGKDGAESSKTAENRGSSRSSEQNPTTDAVEMPRLITNYWPSFIGHSPARRQAGSQMRSGSSSPVSSRDPRPQVSSDADPEMTGPLPKPLASIMALNSVPCDDFESFATGKGSFADPWLTLNKINSEVNLLIMNPGQHSSTSNDSSRIMGNNIEKFYRSCTRKGDTISVNKKRFLSLMAELGGCPLMQWEIGWDISQGDSNFRFVNSMIRLFKMGLMDKQPISLELLPDPDDPSRPILHIGQPEDQMTLVQLTLKSSFEKVRFLQLGLLEVEIYEQIGEVYKFGKALQEARGDHSPKKVKLEDFARRYPGIDWRHIVRDLTGQSSNVNIMISNEKYLSLVEKLIILSDESLIPNYIAVNMFERFGGYIHGRLDEGAGRINCLNLVKSEMDLPISIEFKKSNYQAHLGAKLTKANNIADSIRNLVEVSLRRAKWLSGPSRELSLEKLHQMRIFIALTTPGESNYDEALALDQYGNEPLSNDSSFIDNYLNIRARLASFKLRQLREPTRNAAEWLRLQRKASMEVNYIEEANAIDIPLGILNAPFFDLNQPDYMNYGSLGYLIARNLLKAFNLHGSHFDARGIHGNDLFDSETRVQYLMRLRALLIDLDVPLAVALKTLSKDAIDLGASRIVKEAYEIESKRPLSMDKSSRLANGTTLNPMQLFFVCLTANMACCEQETSRGNMRDELPNPDRVNQVLRYMKQFGDTYNCETGSRMKSVVSAPLDIW